MARNFPLNITVAELKQKIQLIVGTAPQYQELELQDSDGYTFCPHFMIVLNLSARLIVILSSALTLSMPLAMLDDDSFTFGNVQPRDGNIIFVVDTDPSGFIKSVTGKDIVRIRPQPGRKERND